MSDRGGEVIALCEIADYLVRHARLALPRCHSLPTFHPGMSAGKAAQHLDY